MYGDKVGQCSAVHGVCLWPFSINKRWRHLHSPAAAHEWRCPEIALCYHAVVEYAC
jgi:hypothetical protein